jgi:hypothetical protein
MAVYSKTAEIAADVGVQASVTWQKPQAAILHEEPVRRSFIMKGDRSEATHE